MGDSSVIRRGKPTAYALRLRELTEKEKAKDIPRATLKELRRIRQLLEEKK